MKNTTIGTCNFHNFTAAVNYYRGQFGQGAHAEVTRKIKEEEITIGAPALKEGQKLSLQLGRYFISE